MEFDPFVLARIQFAINISFHILFPAITIGLGWLLLYFRLRYTFARPSAQSGLVADNAEAHAWEYAYYFWVKVFALTFALGVVSGITMSFQFGTNWPGFIERTGNIAGPLLGYEVLTAFFLEASFLGIMLFGKDRVSNKVHLTATSLVAIGTTLSAFWILSLNSWMQTPAGYSIVDGVFFPESWTEIIFNPSFPYRFAHMFVASLLTASFLVAGLSAWRMLRKVDGPGTAKVFRTTVVFAAILAPTQMFLGDLHGLNTLEHQPAKVAAMEGTWETERGAPLTLFGIPNEETRETDYAIKIPKLASLILTHDLDGEVPGLNDYIGKHPPVAPVFWSFRVMVGTGVLMLLVSWWGAYYLWRHRRDRQGQKPALDDQNTYPKRLLQAFTVMAFSGWVAMLAGWYVTEIGRQPFIVYGLLGTDEVVADHSAATVGGTLIGYVLLYGVLLAAYVRTLFYLASKPAASLKLIREYDADESPRIKSKTDTVVEA